jgi:hypothetical protein
LLLELYVQHCYLLFMVELPPDVAIFAAVRDMTGRWSILAPVNHHPGGGVGVRCVAVITNQERRAVRGMRDRWRPPATKRQFDSFDSDAAGGSVRALRSVGRSGVTGGSVSALPPAGYDGRR